jgi:arylsulfatase A-like enzyme
MIDRPNILLVVMDAVRAASLEPYGCTAPTSPFLREFAESACTYDRAHATCCWTLPSHASMFTGLTTDQHGLGGRRWSLREVDSPTVAERLRERGYATIAASANPWIGPGFGFDRGFDTFLEGWRLGAMPDLATASLGSGGLSSFERIRKVTAAGPAAVAAALPAAVMARRRRSGHDGSDRLTHRFVRAFAATDRPTFGFVNLLDAHLPRHPPRRHRRALGATSTRSPHPWEYAGGLTPPPSRDAMRALYHAAVRHADEQTGRLVTAVDRASTRPLTVVVTSDHGENVCDHGLMDHQFSLHQTVLHVPLLVREPNGARAGERDPGLVSLADVHGLLVDGTAARARTTITAGYPRPQPPIERLRRRFPRGAFDRYDRSLRACVYDDGRKLIWASDGGHEVYDLNTDPDELRNLWPSPEFADALERLADAPRPDVPDHSRPGGDDSRTEAALRALGYL